MKYKTNELTYILANFPDGNSVLIDVINLANDVLVINADNMVPINGRFNIYKYGFSAVAGQYVWIATDIDTGMYKIGKIIVGQGEDRIDDIHKIHGLDSASPMSVSATNRTVGSINQNITGSSTVTVTRT